MNVHSLEFGNSENNAKNEMDLTFVEFYSDKISVYAGTNIYIWENVYYQIVLSRNTIEK